MLPAISAFLLEPDYRFHASPQRAPIFSRRLRGAPTFDAFIFWHHLSSHIERRPTYFPLSIIAVSMCFTISLRITFLSSECHMPVFWRAFAFMSCIAQMHACYRIDCRLNFAFNYIAVVVWFFTLNASPELSPWYAYSSGSDFSISRFLCFLSVDVTITFFIDGDAMIIIHTDMAGHDRHAQWAAFQSSSYRKSPEDITSWLFCWCDCIADAFGEFRFRLYDEMYGVSRVFSACSHQRSTRAAPSGHA